MLKGDDHIPVLLLAAGYAYPAGAFPPLPSPLHLLQGDGHIPVQLPAAG